jgi:hypothetical protein
MKQVIKKFKLIKEYPGSPKLDTEVTVTLTHDFNSKSIDYKYLTYENNRE